jgi:hypothetical protein
MKIVTFKRNYKRNAYIWIVLAMMPNYPAISTETKYEIANEVSLFIPRQISSQPYYVIIPLKIFVFLLSLTIRMTGPSVITWLHKFPAGQMVERLFRSLVNLIFFENKEVLLCLGEKTGEDRVRKFRALHKMAEKISTND